MHDLKDIITSAARQYGCNIVDGPGLDGWGTLACTSIPSTITSEKWLHKITLFSYITSPVDASYIPATLGLIALPPHQSVFTAVVLHPRDCFFFIMNFKARVNNSMSNEKSTHPWVIDCSRWCSCLHKEHYFYESMFIACPESIWTFAVSATIKLGRASMVNCHGYDLGCSAFGPRTVQCQYHSYLLRCMFHHYRV